MLGKLRAGVLDVTEIHRFANEPVRQNGSLHWDVLRLWLEIKRGLERASSERVASIGVDTWGCDYALLGERGSCSRTRITIATRAPTASWTTRLAARAARRDLRDHRHPVPAVQHALPALRRLPRDAAAARRRATAFVTIPDLFNYWLTGELRCRVHQRHDDAVGRRADADVGDRPAERARHADAAAAAARRAGHRSSARCSRRRAAPRSPARRSSRRRATTPASAVAAVAAGGGTRVPQLRHLVAARHRARRAGDHAARACELNFTNEGGVVRHDAAAEEHRRPVAAAGVPAQRGRAHGHDFAYGELMDAAARRAARSAR